VKLGSKLAIGAALVFQAIFAFPVQQVPDAPSATRPPSPFPAGTKPATKEQPDRPASAPQEELPAPANPATREPDQRDSEGGFTIPVRVNFVSVPVLVKDENDRLVDGLVRKDFAVYENGEPMPINFFSSDPFPLSAAVVMGQNVSDTAMRRVNDTLPAITGAFSEFDEVGLYTYSNTVKRISDYRAANDEFTAALRRAKAPGRQGGVPVVSGPMAAGPTVSGHPAQPGVPVVITPTKESSVLNDALLLAALDLSKRDPRRRKIIFLISDGLEEGSNASYGEVLKVLLTHNISVFALGVDTAALPLYQRLARIKVPGGPSGNVLPKYVSATGGQMFAELSRDAIERSYSLLAGQARNQYTLGYNAKDTVSTEYRSIEVVVKRPGLKVYARDGYYPLPRPRTQPAQ
jgi:VWFA-related protein